jgi:hypothetical protein
MASRVGKDIALPFLDRGIRRGWVVSSTPQPHFYPRERPGTHCTGGWVGPRASLDSGKSRTTGIRSPVRPARSQSLYRLSYLAHRSYSPHSEMRLRTSTERQLRLGVGKSLDAKMLIRVTKGFAMSTLPVPGIYVTKYMRVMFKNWLWFKTDRKK